MDSKKILGKRKEKDEEEDKELAYFDKAISEESEKRKREKQKVKRRPSQLGLLGLGWESLPPIEVDTDPVESSLEKLSISDDKKDDKKGGKYNKLKKTRKYKKSKKSRKYKKSKKSKK